MELQGLQAWTLMVSQSTEVLGKMFLEQSFPAFPNSGCSWPRAMAVLCLKQEWTLQLISGLCRPTEA